MSVQTGAAETEPTDPSVCWWVFHLLLNVLRASSTLSFCICKVHTFLLKFPCAFQSLRDVNFGFSPVGLDKALAKSWWGGPTCHFTGRTSSAEPLSTSFYPEKATWKNCILWCVTLVLKGLFLKINQKSLSFEALGPKCPGNCSTENNRQCLVKNSGDANCVCLPGYKEDNRGICQL